MKGTVLMISVNRKHLTAKMYLATFVSLETQIIECQTIVHNIDIIPCSNPQFEY